MKKSSDTADYAVIADAGGSRYRFFCSRSGIAPITTRPISSQDADAALRLAWESEGRRHFNRCGRCGRWVADLMYNVDTAECVLCSPLGSAPPTDPLGERLGFGLQAMQKVKVCADCGRPAPAAKRFCTGCGAPLPPETLFDRYQQNTRTQEETQMAFFDRLNDLAKNLGEKTNDAIEISRYSARVTTERAAAAEECRKLGEHYYALFTTGVMTEDAAPPEVWALCQSAKAHLDAAAEAQAEIERIRAENEAAKAAEAAALQAAAAAAPAAPTAPTASAPGPVCTGCGAANAPGTKFCQSCGSKLEPPAAPEPKTCPSCGATLTAAQSFCGSCGTKVE